MHSKKVNNYRQKNEGESVSPPRFFIQSLNLKGVTFKWNKSIIELTTQKEW